MSSDSTFVKLTNKAAIPEGCGKAIAIGERAVAVFNLEGEFYAIDNVCPHRGASLGHGAVEGRKVICPWHGWEFDIPTGRMWKADGVRTYAVEIRGEEIWVDTVPG